MPNVDSYLFFDGNCADAMRFYEKALGGKIDMMMKASDSPEADKMPRGSGDKIMHAHLTLSDGRGLMASDWIPMPGHPPYQGMKGFSLSLQYPKAADAKRVFDALAQGGKVTMPMTKTFWSEAFGMLVDRFGTPWMVGVASGN